MNCNYPIAESAAFAHSADDVVFALALTSEGIALQIAIMNSLGIAGTILAADNRIVPVRVGVALIASGTGHSRRADA